MTKYYLNLITKEAVLRDLEGADFDTIDIAEKEAVSGAKSIVADSLRKGVELSDSLQGSIEIVDHRGNILKVITFSEAVEINTETWTDVTTLGTDPQ